MFESNRYPLKKTVVFVDKVKVAQLLIEIKRI